MAIWYNDDHMNNKRFIYLYSIILAIILGVLIYRELMPKPEALRNTPKPLESVTNFEECVQSGAPVRETYPRQCVSAGGTMFSEYIGNELEKTNLITIDSPRPTAELTHTITISGKARGTWYFEASFPISLEDVNGKEITNSIAKAQGEWMTESFVPFTSTLSVPSTFSGSARLILKKDNPSGEAQFADELIVPITIK